MTYLEDPLIKGANYVEYVDNLLPSQVDVKITKFKKKGYQPKGEAVPMGVGYVFDDTPAMLPSGKTQRRG